MLNDDSGGPLVQYCNQRIGISERMNEWINEWKSQKVNAENIDNDILRSNALTRKQNNNIHSYIKDFEADIGRNKSQKLREQKIIEIKN